MNPDGEHVALNNLYLYMCEECNLACRHCWQSALYRAPQPDKLLPLGVYQSIVEQALPLGLRFVKISGGEPLLRRDDVMVLAEYVSQRGVSVRVETNGTLIDDDVARHFARHSVRVSVSLDGATAETHQNLRMTAGCFDKTLAGLACLQRHRVSTELVFAMHRGNVGDLPAVVDIARRFDCSSVKINPILNSGRGAAMDRKGDLMGPLELQAFAREVELTYADSRPPVALSTASAFHSLQFNAAGRVLGGRCRFRHLAGLLANGSLSFCGMGYRTRDFVLMDARDGSLAETWARSPVLEEVREAIPGSLQGVCGNCVARPTCQGGCRAEAVEVYGSITAPSPACQELYEAGGFPKARLIDTAKDCRFTGLGGTA